MMTMDAPPMTAAPVQGELGMAVPESDQYSDGIEYLHTAMRFKDRDPEKYQAVLEAVKKTGNILLTAKAFRVSRNTIYAIIQEEMGGMDQFRAHLQSKLLFAAHIGIEQTIEMLPNCKDPVKSSMVVGIVMDKHAMLSGAPGLVVEHRVVHEEQVNNFKAELEAMRTRLLERKANAIELEAA